VDCSRTRALYVFGERMIYNKQPVALGQHEVEAIEFFDYLYLPIKLTGQSNVTVERRLRPIQELVGVCACDFIGEFGLDRFVDSFMYVTAKNKYQPPGQAFNRPGWHSDGFGFDDISYIWSNRQPTVFNSTAFDLCDDDKESMREMNEQAHESLDYVFPDCTLLRMDQFTIHRVGEPIEGVRCFVKIVFSRDMFRLQGNSINYDLDYQWEYIPRASFRNIPQGHKQVPDRDKMDD